LELKEEWRTIIWGWASDPNSMFNLALDPATDIENAEAPCSSTLSRIIQLLRRMDAELVVNTIRWRLLLMLVVEIIDRGFPGNRDKDDLAEQFRYLGIISDNVVDYFKENLENWLRGGRRYLALGSSLGGNGSVIYLPEFGRTTYVCTQICLPYCI
jgi:hypothetical protein